MTYKKIVEGLVEHDVYTWVNGLLKEYGYDAFVYTGSVDFENDSNSDTIMWTVEIDVWLKTDIVTKHLLVGGTADDVCGICRSVIWNDSHDIIWMNVPETRKSLSIDTFRI